MMAHTRGRRFWHLVLVAVGLYLGAMFLIGLLYTVRTCIGSYAAVHCGVDNPLAWGDTSWFGVALLIYLVLVFGLWTRR
ncbi:hypothetical protein OK351_10890 [Glutamicibacter sp. MNS18]|uniref:hypothetical protein n=1 Tax=Glutamicibacter sp. MNS18 TaxID=2989817 RepID=UPI002235A433|nr:hypothetical protein [Glutamicibacter sp. MNS18]MCW4466011.1 hypothetical protein [Glutamicibacter sp. MNS18]